MINSVEIYSQNDLERKCRKNNFNDAVLISIGNPHWFFSNRKIDEKIPVIFKTKFDSILRLEFFDLVDTKDVQPWKPRRIPKLRDLNKVISFYNDSKYNYNRVIIHCWGGISRSTAMGLLVLFLIHKNVDIAIRELKKLQPYALPHAGILTMIDQLYETNFLEHRMEIIRCWKERIQKDLILAQSEGLEEVIEE